MAKGLLSGLTDQATCRSLPGCLPSGIRLGHVQSPMGRLPEASPVVVRAAVARVCRTLLQVQAGGDVLTAATSNVAARAATTKVLPLEALPMWPSDADLSSSRPWRSSAGRATQVERLVVRREEPVDSKKTLQP